MSRSTERIVTDVTGHRSQFDSVPLSENVPSASSRTDNGPRENGSEVDWEEVARVRLQHSPYRALRRVTCDFVDGALTLRGSVPTFHYKQLAQVAVLGLQGVTRIVNEIDVDGR